MKKFIPFIFPAAAAAIVLLLAFRWYSMKTNQPDENQSLFTEGVQIENLTESEIESVVKGTGDYKSIQMSAEDEGAMGDIRYEIKDGKVVLSVMATLDDMADGQYQVWFKEVAGDAIRKAFVLEMNKGGYMGSASVPSDVLPFEVLVSKEMNNDDQMEELLLKAVIAE